MDLTPDQQTSLSRFVELLLDANARMNLTAITDRAAAYAQHVDDSLTLLPFLPKEPFALADVGSGGGAPGIPLAIARPDVSVVLIESTQKKAKYLADAVRQLGLTNVTVDCDRAENIARTDRRESFDVVTARAVGALAWLAEWCLPLVKKGGSLLAMKGAKIADELPPALKAIKLLGGAYPTSHRVTLPGREHHVIVEIKKNFQTDLKYPRDPTTTRGKPL